MAVEYRPPLPLVIGTEETVVVSNQLDRDNELEIVFKECGLGSDAPDFERYLTIEQVELLRDHLDFVLKTRRTVL